MWNFLLKRIYKLHANKPDLEKLKLPTKKTPGPVYFSGELYWSFNSVERWVTPMLTTLLENKRGGATSQIMLWGKHSLITKHDKEITKSYWPTFLVNINVKVLDEIPANQIQ